MTLHVELAERRLVPDRLIRLGIRRLLRKRLESEQERTAQSSLPWLASLESAKVATETSEANRQHYEVPAAFYRIALGPQLKYSSALWPPGVTSLADAEEHMLARTAERAQLRDGQRILELGCGWGSLTLWMARHFPNASIVAVSNSASQRSWILDHCEQAGIGNVEVITADINDFEAGRHFDRVVSVEMFEHVRHWEELLRRVRSWLTDDGLLFLHFFAHREFAYAFEKDGDDDWMAEHFFSGGIMPSRDLLSKLTIPFRIAEQWEVSGTHYAKTAEAWLQNLDAAKPEAGRVLSRLHGPIEGARMLQRWRMFFLACAELFGFDHGREWMVAHVLLTPASRESST